ncbi:MAG: hypothetical protein H0T43_09820 [Solirubrobacterales bacterium]|nr:hypothetical protein [Solirubrobacterales bacterium]
MQSLTRNEIVAMLGGLLLVAGLFIKWYEAVSPRAELAGSQGLGTYTGWDTHSLMRWLLILGAIAPFILAYIVVRDHQLSWARGEMTAVVAIIAFGLLFYNGIVDRPGEPSGQIELEWGWYVALAGSLLMLGGSALRSSETERRRKPPGTI